MVPARAPRVYLHLGAVVLGAVLRTRSDAERDLELLAQRHQVTILSRQVHRPELIPADRLILAAVGRRLLAGRLLFSPSTLLRWHREIGRIGWARCYPSP
jgi:hypothetical protein